MFRSVKAQLVKNLLYQTNHFLHVLGATSGLESSSGGESATAPQLGLETPEPLQVD